MGLFLALLGGHYLADFPLQSEHIAKNKGKVFIEAIGFHCLTAHAAIQGLIAASVASYSGHSGLLAGLMVGMTHWVIDFGKSWERWPEGWRITNGAQWSGNPDARGLYGINVDQCLHSVVLVVLSFLLVR